MKKKTKLFAGLLTVLSAGTLMACTNTTTPAEAKAVAPTAHILRANSNTTEEADLKHTFKNVIESSCAELGIPSVTLANPNDYKDQMEFKFNIFTYTREIDSSTGKYKITSEWSPSEIRTAETIIYQNMTIGYEINGDRTKSVLFDGNSAVNCKVLVTDTLPLNFNGMTKLETLILLDENVKVTNVPDSLKNIVFVGSRNLQSQKWNSSAYFDSSLLSKDIKFCCTEENIYYYAPAMASAGGTSTAPADPVSKIYLIDNPTNFHAKWVTHSNGLAYVGNGSSTYNLVATDPYVTSAVIDNRSEDVKYSYGSYTNYSKIELDDLYVYQGTSSSDTAYSGIFADNLYFMNCTSINAKYFKTFKNVYFVGHGSSLSWSSLTTDPGFGEDLKIYAYEDSGEYDYLSENQYTSPHLVKLTAAPETYVPKVTVDYKGVEKSTTELGENSYSTVLAEAKAAYRAANTPSTPGSNTGSESEKEETKTPSEEEIERKEHAEAVMTLIDSIGEVSIDSREAIIEAKEAFDALTAKEQKLVENIDDLKAAIKAYNELIKDDKDLKPIENIKMKTVIGEKFDSFIDQVKENKTLTIVTSILGAVTGLLIIYLLYKLIRKFVRWVRR